MAQNLDIAKVQKKRKKKKQGGRQFKITLSVADQKRIQYVCEKHNLSPSIALRRMIKEYLDNVVPELEESVENQLDLFEPKQRTIFDS